MRHEPSTETETFTCSPFLLTLLLVGLEIVHDMYSIKLSNWVETWTDAGWVRGFANLSVSIFIFTLIGILFERQSEVIVEEDYLQIGDSPMHYYRVDEISEIKLKNGILHIRTEHFWRSGRYTVQKKQREKAHLLMWEWAEQHGIVYKIM